MVIKTIKVSNFRNLSGEFNLHQRCAVKGKNHIGKTNLINAIHWCLTDSLVDGSNEIDTIIPIGNRRESVSVQLTFDDGRTWEKKYYEKWERRRGSDEEFMNGHETSYYYNGIRFKTKSEAITRLKELLLKDSQYPQIKEIDMIKTLVNPKYLTEQVKWQDLRKFITSMIKEINDYDVFVANPELKSIELDLAKCDGRIDVLRKRFTDAYKVANDEKTKVSIRKEVAEEKRDANCVTEEEIENAQLTIEHYNKGISEIRTGKPVDTSELTNKIAELKTKRSQLMDLEAERKNKHYDGIVVIDRALHDKKIESYELETRLTRLKNKNKELSDTIEKNQALIEKKSLDKKSLLKTYTSIKGEEFIFSKSICPNCNYQLNEEEENTARENFENYRSVRLMKNVEDGKKIVAEMNKASATIESSMLEKANLNQELEGLEKELEQVKKECEELDNQYISYEKYQPIYTDEITDINIEIEKITLQIKNINSNAISEMSERTNTYLKEHEEELSNAKSILAKKSIYEDAIKDIELAEEDEIKVNRTLMGLDVKKELLKKFTLAKMDMVNKATREVFPDVEFILIENNITEGSFNEVCYPLIKGKKTPYDHGSGSERLLTSIAIVEDIKKKLNLPNLPIIFDEGECLDSDSIDGIKTKSQIITSVVDDNYDEPTIVLI